MLRNHQPRVGRHDQTFGGQQAVRDVTGIFVKERDRRHELTNQAERRAQVKVKSPLGRHPQNVREPRPFDVVRDDREPARMTIHAPDTRVVGVPEVREPGRALAQRELEGRNGQQLRSQAENLQQIAAGSVDGNHAVAEAIGEERRLGALGRSGDAGHRVACGFQLAEAASNGSGDGTSICVFSRARVQPPDRKPLASERAREALTELIFPVIFPQPLTWARFTALSAKLRFCDRRGCASGERAAMLTRSLALRTERRSSTCRRCRRLPVAGPCLDMAAGPVSVDPLHGRSRRSTPRHVSPLVERARGARSRRRGGMRRSSGRCLARWRSPNTWQGCLPSQRQFSCWAARRSWPTTFF